MGYVNLMTTFTSKSYLLKVSLAQALICMQYDLTDTDELTIGEIMQMTEIRGDEIKRALFHLCKPKVKLLLKQVKKPTFDDMNEKIRINRAFASKTRRLALLPSMQAGGNPVKRDPEEQKAMHESIMKERSLKTQVAIAKVMKARKVVLLQDLMDEVFRKIEMFHAQPSMIKQ